MTLTRDEVFEYCLKSVIIDHRLRARARHVTRSELHSSEAVSSKGVTSSKNSPMTSILDIIATTTSSKRSQKFPSQLVKLLGTALQKVVMRQDPEYEDVQVRSTFGAFYSYYTSDSFQKSIKADRKIEDLILMFFSKATGELQKRLPEDEVKHLVNQHVAKFIRLVLRLTREHKLASSDSDFVIKLTGYESQLLRNSNTLAVSEKLAEKPQQLQEPGAPSVSQVPSARALQVLFKLDESALQARMCNLYDDCTLETALRDLKTQLHYISTQSASSCRIQDFDSAEQYSSWRQQEITYLTKTILRLSTLNPVLANLRVTDRIAPQTPDAGSRSRANSTSSEKSSKARPDSVLFPGSSTIEIVTNDEMNLSLIPHNKYMVYRELLGICLDFELSKRPELATAVTHISNSAIYGRDAQDVLKVCRDWWRISGARHTVTYLEVCTQRFVNDQMSLEFLDDALSEIAELKDNHKIFTIDEKELYKRAIKSLHESLFRDLYAELQCVYSRKLDTRVITIIEEHIHTDELFHEAAPETADVFDQMEQGIKEAAVEAYTNLHARVMSEQDLEVLLVVRLGNSLCNESRKLRSRFKSPIMDLFDVWQIHLETTFPMYLSDVPKLMTNCYRKTRAEGVEFALEDMFELYRVISQIHDYLHRYHPPGYKSPVNIDLYFRPVVMKWLSRAQDSITELVPRILMTDSFTLDDIAGDDAAVCSPSIVLLFKSFNQHLNFLKDLQWSDEYWFAKFLTSLSRILSAAVREYCEQVEKLFTKETSYVLEPESNDEAEPLSLQRRLIAKARDTIIKKEHTEPFHIIPTACVKLNNIEWAKVHLDMLENSLDCATTSELIERVEGSRTAWTPGQTTLFSVEIISAENLVPCDSNGYSDPYVVLSDQKGKRVAKTRTIYTDLNPRWEETFDVPCTEALWLAATVWDRDTKGEHDICGRCHVKLDPRYFEDGFAKDFHVNLDTQGILHLRITMEIELDDPIFYFGRAFRFLNRAENDMTRSIVDKMTPFINTSLSRHTLKLLFSKPISVDSTIDSAYNLLNRAGFATTRLQIPEKQTTLTNQEMEAPIEGLLQYLDNNFKVLDQSLTRAAFDMVMCKLWNHVVITLEDLLLPPLFSSPSKHRRPLKEVELDVVYKWLGFLKDTFAGDGGGLSEEELQTPVYQELLSIRFFYFDSIEDLIHECDRIAASSAAATKNQEFRQASIQRRPKAYNLGTIKKAKDKSLAIRRMLGNSEDIILRVREQPMTPVIMLTI